MTIQPGVGYTFTSSSMGTNLNIEQPWTEPSQGKQYQQFQCEVVKEPDGAGDYNYFLKTYKGVCNYTWSNFPFYPEPVSGGGEVAFRSFEKQARITDWAVYQNGKRTAGTATDGPGFEWFAGDGKIEILNGDYEGGSNTWLVTISKIDWWDRDNWLSAYRTIDAEKPFVSVFPADDTEIAALMLQQGCSLHSGNTIYENGGSFSNDPPVPLQIGYTYKKIAQLDWNDTTNSWDVTQYLVGPIDLPIQRHSGSTFLNFGTAPSPSSYDTALAGEFDGCLNYAWFEGMWAYPGYTMNPSAWWYDLVNA